MKLPPVPAAVLGFLGFFNFNRKAADEGSISLKLSSDPSLCVTTEELYERRYEPVFLMLEDCSLKTGQKPFQVKVSKGSRQVMTTPGRFDGTENGCFYAGKGNVDDSIILSTKCSLRDSLQHWSFNTVSGSKVHWVHEETGKCVRAPKITAKSALELADCDENDENQIWATEFWYKKNAKQDTKGEIILKPAVDESLCMATARDSHDRFSTEEATVVMNLMPCNKFKKRSEQAQRIFELKKIANDFVQIETSDYTAEGSFGCMYTELESNARIMSKDCDKKDKEQQWKLLRLSPNGRVQMQHRESEKCISASKDLETVMTADCDPEDDHQIWIMETSET